MSVTLNNHTTQPLHHRYRYKGNVHGNGYGNATLIMLQKKERITVPDSQEKNIQLVWNYLSYIHSHI